MPISVASRASGYRVTAALRGALAGVVREALAGVERSPGTIAIVLARDPELRELNRRWRGIDRATDVLSFPYADRRGRIDGDLVISLDRLAAQAKRYRVSEANELARLVVHGALHLAGFDHHRVAERRVMRARERAVLRGVRTGSASPLARAFGALALLLFVAITGIAAASVARAGATATPQAPPSHVAEPTLADWVPLATAADSARIGRLEFRIGVAPDSAHGSARVWNTREVAKGRGDRRWIGRFTALLADSMAFFPHGRCAAEDTLTHGVEDLAVGIRFGAGDSAATALILMRERCVQLTTRRRPAGALGIERPGARQALLALLDEALPHDVAVRHAIDVASQSAAAGGDTAEPVIGDYIFAEELPQAVLKVPPIYPDAARGAGVSGTVLVQALVGKNGLVKRTVVKESIPLLDDAATASVRQWVFKPALSRGSPIAVWVTVPVKFTLH